MTGDLQLFCQKISGVSMECAVRCKNISFSENILFTHRGLSGPAMLQVSLYWCVGDTIVIDFLPQLTSRQTTLFQWFLQKKQDGVKQSIKNLLTHFFPRHNDIFLSRCGHVRFVPSHP